MTREYPVIRAGHLRNIVRRGILRDDACPAAHGSERV
jgi:hypothetical protein